MGTKAFSAILMSFVLAACSSSGMPGISNGIGTDLPWNGMSKATQGQEAYIAQICEQAGLSPPGGGPCRLSEGSSADWGIFVQAGLNDIDSRCDAYLAWLDEQKRSSTPILQEIAAVGTAAQALLQISGAGAASITAAGIGLGLASSTFNNITSRLLLEVDHSTVQAVVTSSRNDLRSQIIGASIDNRPAAIYVLQTYIRACSPFQIEAAINNNLTVYSLAGTKGLDNQMPLLSGNLILHSSARPVPIIKASTPSPNRFSDFLPKNDLQQIQRALCISVSGKMDQPTETSILAYLNKVDRNRPPELRNKIMPRDEIFLGDLRDNPPACPR